MEDETDIELGLLLEAIYAKYQFDFRQYTRTSLKRRLRHALEHFGVLSLSGLQERVLREPQVFYGLLSYLTVQVSEMFRDPEFFRVLRERVVPILQTYPSIKLWVPGCSTGEEVYSLAIVLREEGLLERCLIYATDINAASLDVAQRGIYAERRLASFSQAYYAAGGKTSLSDYFTLAYGSAKFDGSLRAEVLFSDHSLATDQVFAEVQLISCRNVLIYFTQELKDRAVGLFRDSLARKGFLALGAKETLRFTAHAQVFSEFAPEQRIYQRR